MIDLKALQQRVYANKVRQWFNVTNVDMEFGLTYGELAEAYRAYYKKMPDLPEEIADVVIYILWLSEILHIDLEKEILRKMDINEKRTYKKVRGVPTRVKEKKKR